MVPRTLRRLSIPACALLCCAPLRPTWSIVLVDTRTREVAVGSATCLVGTSLRRLTPVVLVGQGAAVAQARIDTTAVNRIFLFAALTLGMPPAQMLAQLARRDSLHQNRQYGIVDTLGRSASFTGTRNGAWAGQLTGRSGTLVWAIQGNVLTGFPVVQKADAAIRNTKGDLAEKLMAAMEAARKMGGDGRCSCRPSNPTGCGSPPKSFTKSAHIGFMIVARQGDRDGTCDRSRGCATGTYYLNLDVASKRAPDPDPVLILRSRFNQWRTLWVARPDHHLSTLTLAPPTLPDDGSTTATATLTLRDWRGSRLPTSTARITVTLDPASTAQVHIGPVTARGGGVFTFPVRAGRAAGKALLRVVADDGRGPVLLSPRTELPLTADPLWVSRPAISAAQGGRASFLLRAGGSHARRLYLLLASSSGTKPGIRVGKVVIPVHYDLVSAVFLSLASSPALPAFAGVLDAKGRALAGLLAPPGALRGIQGRDLTFAWALLAPVDLASNPVAVSVRR